eukprot:12878-Heterococcus_DN1.PRE.2
MHSHQSDATQALTPAKVAEANASNTVQLRILNVDSDETVKRHMLSSLRAYTSTETRLRSERWFRQSALCVSVFITILYLAGQYDNIHCEPHLTDFAYYCHIDCRLVLQMLSSQADRCEVQQSS